MQLEIRCIYIYIFFLFLFFIFYFFFTTKMIKIYPVVIDRATSACASAAIMVSAPHNVRCAGISIRHAQVTYIHAFTLNSPSPPSPPPLPPRNIQRLWSKGGRRCFALSRQISVTHTLSQLMYYRHTTFTLYRIV